MSVEQDVIREMISRIKSQRSLFAMVYKNVDDDLSNKYKTESRILEGVVKILYGEKSCVKREPDERAARNQLGWTALVIDALGVVTAIIYSSEAAAEKASQAFDAVHGDAEADGIIGQTADIDLSGLSSNLLWSSSPRTAYAVISEVGRHYSVSLHDTPEEASSAVERFEEDAADAYERSDASCCVSVVALPRIEFGSPD